MQTVLIRVKAFYYIRKEIKALDDSKIVELYLIRNEAAIKQTKEKHGKRLWSLSYGIVCDFQTAEECENDTYMEAWGQSHLMSPNLTFMLSLQELFAISH